MAGNYDGSIRIDSSIDGKGFNAGIKAMIGSLKGLAAAVGIAFGVGAVVAFGKAAVDAASEMSSAFIGLQSIMDGQGRNFSQAKKFINDYIADGLVPATNAITTYKNLAMRGYDTSQIEKIMIALKNSSAFGRQSSLTLGQAVQSASEGLKNENSILVDNAGVTKNVSIMWKEYAKSLGVGVESLTQAQKREAEYNGIMQETRFQMGDAAKLAGTYAGQMAALGVSFNNLKVAFGNSLIPIITVILPYIRRAIDAMTEFFTAVSQVSSVLFGVQASTGQSATNLEDAAAASADLMDNLTGSGKAAKGALAGFDQLNVLQQDTAGGPGTTPKPISLPPVDTTPLTDSLSNMAQKILEFKDKLLQFFDPAIQAFNRLVIALTPLGETIWAGLKWAWDNIFAPFGSWVMNELVPAFLDMLAKGAEILSIALDKLKPLGIWLWENFLLPLSTWVGDQIIKGITMFTKGLEVLALLLKGDFAGAWDLFKEMLADAWKNLQDTWTDLSGWFNRVVLTPLLNLFAPFWEDIKVLAKKAWDGITDLWNKAKEWFETNVIAPLKDVFSPMWSFIEILAQDAWAVIKFAWEKASTWFMENVSDPVSKLFSEAWADVKTFTDQAWEDIKSTFTDIGEWFSLNVGIPIQNAFGEAFDSVKQKLEDAFVGVKEFMKGVINQIIDLLNNMLNGAIGGLNDIIDSLNQVGVNVPGWITIPNLTAPQIPYLATGAVIPPNSQFLAMLGDQRSGRNIEAPEGLIRQIVREETQQGSREIIIRFEGSMSELVRYMRPHLLQENVRMGNNTIQGGFTP